MLRLLGTLYGRVANARNHLYDRGVFRAHSLAARTISIGNITTGGTGKTPLVALVSEILAGAGEKVCILTRGYGRDNERLRVLVSDGESVLVDARTGGDEPVELARRLIGKAIVVADSDRVAAAAWAKDKFGITAFVLDDAFQHRRAKRDVDIVCVDAMDPFGNGRVLPAGSLRETLPNLQRANALFITRANLVADVDAVVTQLRSRNADAPIFVSENEMVGATRLDGSGSDPDWKSLRACSNRDNEVRILAFCGLGNPDAFFTDLLGAFEHESMHDEFDLAVIKHFPDHHRYSQSDIVDLERQAYDVGVHALVTTAKDAVKLEGLRFELPCFIVHAEMLINDPAAFHDLIISS